MGVMERQNGDYAAARNHLQQAIALEPDVYNSHYNLGLALVKLNEPRAAKEHFEKALALGSPDPEVHLELATVLKKLGENEAAEKQLQLYREASQAQSNQSVAQAKATLAEKELDSGDPGKAAALYREALEATPNDALLNYKLSVALDKAGDRAGEHEALQKTVQIDPDMAIAQNQLGYLDSRSGDIASAEAHFRQAVRAAPRFAEAWVNLAATLGMESKFQEAQNAVDTALKLDPENSEALQLRRDLTASQAQH
jgi:tetratricopeptide (TPR) repeat protein